MKRVVVFGSTGFVGSAVLQRLARQHNAVEAVGVSRAGKRPAQVDANLPIQWRAGDALVPATYEAVLEGAAAVVVAIGSPPLPFVDYEYQLRMNGESNERVLETAREKKVPVAVVVGATMPRWTPRGYFDGKRRAEAAARRFVDEAGNRCTLLKPSAIYGTRYHAGYPVPLSPVLAPASWLLSSLGRDRMDWAASAAPSLLEGLLVPPVPVDAVAHACVDAALQETVPISSSSGLLRVLGPFEILDAYSENKSESS